MKLSPEQQAEYDAALDRTQRYHESKRGKTFSGRFTWKQRHRIKGIIDRFSVTSICDYGCGWGKQYIERDDQGRSLVEYWGVEPAKYDPGVRHFKADPVGKFDLVICVQALGSIPTTALPAVIDRLYGYANKAIYVAERLGETRKPIFQDMKKAMPHGQPMEWWLDMLARPGSPVRMVVAFHSKDEAMGWVGWRTEEPEGQG
jgi:hypothetical protein